jgi:hypothetical protein
MPLCSQNIYVYQPEHDDMPSSCVNNIVSRDVVFKAEFCGITLSSLVWNETNYLKVYGFSDGMYKLQSGIKVLCDEIQPIGTVDINAMLTNSPSITVYS